MAMSNNISDLLNKIERRLGLKMITPHLPPDLNKDAWAEIILEDTLVTFSRFYPRKLRFTVNSETCNKVRENHRWVYYIKDEILGGIKLLGVSDIDWQDTSADNISVGQTAGYGYYIPNYGGVESTYESFLSAQMTADIASLYNNHIYVEFEEPNKIILSRAGNVDVNLDSFVINLLVQHHNLATLSPTMMETFEQLAQADIAKTLFMHLRYVDNLETIYLVTDLKLSELEQEANRRQEIMDKIEQSYVSASNSNIPYIMTVNG